jgi:uncharacterized protein YutE (UPF0331/DUF86 family)
LPKYINLIPKPLLDDIINDRCIPVIGAGFSKNANLPNGLSMPLWSDLGKNLAKRMEVPAEGTPIELISEFEEEFSRAKLVEALNEDLHIDQASPGDIHFKFADIPFDEIITTNFDFLLEKAYEKRTRNYHPILDDSQLPIGQTKSGDLLRRQTRILKMHGDLNHPSRLIVTESDYDTFVHDYPLLSTYVANLLMVRTPLFIGYSLDDPDFRGIWQLIGSRLGKMRRMGYTLTVGMRAADVARFERRGIKVISLGSDRSKYGEILSALFEELRKYWLDNLSKVSTATNEETLLEMEKPSDSNTRLCFFAIPYRLLPFYRSNIYKVFREHGFVPSSSLEVVPPSGSYIATVYSMIERSSLIVADIASAESMDELVFALRRTSIISIVIVEEDREIPMTIPQNTFVVRRKKVLDDSATDDLVRKLQKILKVVLEQIGTRLTDEPKRLFEKGEYRAATISAITVLEAALREKLRLRRPTPLRETFHQAKKEDILSSDMYDRISKWIPIRNQIAHTTIEITKEEAEEIVDAVYQILKQIGKWN